MQPGSMVLGVVADGYDTVSLDACFYLKPLQELPEALTVEPPGLPSVNKLAIVEAHRSKIADALSCRGMVQNRISGLRRNPHPGTRTVLLKMHFVQSPDVNSWIFPQFAEFFLNVFLRVLVAPAMTGRG